MLGEASHQKSVPMIYEPRSELIILLLFFIILVLVLADF